MKFMLNKNCKFSVFIIRIIFILTFLFSACKEKTFKTYYNESINNYNNIEYEKAIFSLKKSIELNPEFRQGYRRIILIYKEANLLDDGIDYFQKQIGTFQESAYSNYAQGMLFLYSGEFNKAIEKFRFYIKGETLAQKIAREIKGSTWD